MTLVFSDSQSGTLGIELELQLIDLSDFDLASSASYLLQHFRRVPDKVRVTPELTESMIEISAGIFTNWMECVESMQSIQSMLSEVSQKLNLGICGGGAHPFQRWQQRRIFDNQRFQRVSSLYGYLAKQFTVFGQHVHVGCSNANEALLLLHGLNRYIPHFIALAASSPFFQGTSTSFHSSRLNSIAAFPLSGRAPYFMEWKRFIEDFYEPMLRTGIISSMKDFYWDLRPKPEYGTIELRVCDTPLSLYDAALIAGYMQLLCRAILLENRQSQESDYLVYSYNRFQASRFGFDADYVDPLSNKRSSLRESIAETLAWLSHCARADRFEDVLLHEVQKKIERGTDASELVQHYRRSGTMEDVVLHAINRFVSPFPK